METYNIQSILETYGKEFLKLHPLSLEQLKVYYAIKKCKTPSLGFHIVQCDECGDAHIGLNSCRNKHCPMCQDYAKEQWVLKESEYLLDVPYFFIGTTVPEELNPLFLQNKKVMYNLLFKATGETILKLGNDSQYLGAELGITSILHTWGQTMNMHPHIHSIVTGGGLKDNKWINLKKDDFLFPVKVFSDLFKKKFLSLLKEAQLEFFNDLEYLKDKDEFDKFVNSLYDKKWVEYIEPPKGSPLNAIEYMGRYSFKIAISNKRIKNIENDQITFEYKDYKENGITKTMTISVFEFIRRFFLHILPDRFCKIRHYGLLQNRNRKKKVKQCIILIGITAFSSFLKSNKKRIEIICSKCGGTRFSYSYYYSNAPPSQNNNFNSLVYAS